MFRLTSYKGFQEFSVLTAAQKQQDEITVTSADNDPIYRIENPAGNRVVFSCDVYIEQANDPESDVRLVIRQRAPNDVGTGTTAPAFTNKIGEWVRISTSADFADPRVLDAIGNNNAHCRIVVTNGAVARFRRPSISMEALPHMPGQSILHTLGGTDESLIRLGGGFAIYYKRVTLDLTQTENRFDIGGTPDIPNSPFDGNQLICGWCLSSTQTDGGSIAGDLPKTAVRARTKTYDGSDVGATDNTISIFSDGDTLLTNVDAVIWCAGRTQIVDQDWDV